LLTIEDCILSALIEKKYTDKIEESGFEAASRTDRLVSARGACFTCIMKKKPILMEINSALPREIGVWAYAEVPLHFRLRYNALTRHYLYILPNPLSNLKKNSPLNFNIMYKACKQLEGTHDFVNFSKRDKNEVLTVRTMDYVKLHIINDFLVFQFKSRAFLRQQVRRMVKKILELGMGKINYNEFNNLFDPLRILSFQPADPRGLILWDIKYDEKVKLKEDLKSKERMESFFIKRELVSSFNYQLFKLLQQDDVG
jgi:tRNA pseudouridine38-40 synthase